MKVSKKGQYALISIVDLAINALDKHESIVNIAERQNIDAGTLGQIFFLLKKAGIISSVRGKNGGYFLLSNADEINAGDVIRAVEGDLTPTKCCVDPQAAQNCKTYEACFTIGLWQQLTHEINSTLDGITIGHLVRKFKTEYKNETE